MRGPATLALMSLLLVNVGAQPMGGSDWPGQPGSWPGQQGSWRDQAYTWPLIWPGQQGNWPQPQVQQHWPTWRATWKFLPHLGRWILSSPYFG